MSRKKVIIIGIIFLILSKINYQNTGIYFFKTWVAVVLIKILSDITAGDV